MAKLIRTITAVLNAPVEHEELRFSRGIGPRNAPKL
jgi:hypothetical protein